METSCWNACFYPEKYNPSCHLTPNTTQSDGDWRKIKSGDFYPIASPLQFLQFLVFFVMGIIPLYCSTFSLKHFLSRLTPFKFYIQLIRLPNVIYTNKNLKNSTHQLQKKVSHTVMKFLDSAENKLSLFGQKVLAIAAGFHHTWVFSQWSVVSLITSTSFSTSPWCRRDFTKFIISVLT